MSRLAKKPVLVPSGVNVVENNLILTVTGPKGTLKKHMHPYVSLTTDGQSVSVEKKSSTRLANALLGTFSAHLRNMVHGVVEGYEKKLVIEGIGYKVEIDEKNITLFVGFSHSVILTIPDGLEVSVEKNTVTIKGIDKEKVGAFAANVRAVKKPEPYKGKGIRYSDEVVKRKAGKTK